MSEQEVEGKTQGDEGGTSVQQTVNSEDSVGSEMELAQSNDDSLISEMKTAEPPSDVISKDESSLPVKDNNQNGKEETINTSAVPESLGDDNEKLETNSEEISKELQADVVDSDDDDEGICLGDGSDLDSDGRNKMFEKGLSFERNGKINKALKCYMACLNGLNKDSRFALLPQCLRNIADIFFHKEEYEKAVHFIQAEKVYYESALIDTQDVQTKLEEAQQKEGGLPFKVSSDAVRASEYEHLARLCLDRDQPQLALEYAGKATKLRQHVLGDKDPVTVESLDFFASVYAKVGAEQYGESLKKLTETPEDDEMLETEQNGAGDQKEPVSILRKRKNSEKEKKVHFDESQLQSQEHQQSEEKFAKTVLWFLLMICLLLLVVLGIYLYCNLAGSHTCTKLKSDIYYAYMRVKYWYYQYQSGPHVKFT